MKRILVQIGISKYFFIENLYWSDYMKNVIEVSRLDGTHRYVLAINSTQHISPKSLAVDPING